MKKELGIYSYLLFISWFLYCMPHNNPYDPENPDFKMPKFGASIDFLDQETTKRIKNASINYSYKGNTNSCKSDTAGKILLWIDDNLTQEKISVQIDTIISPGYRPPGHFSMSFHKNVNDTDIGLWPVAPHPVAWDTGNSVIDTFKAALTWNMSTSKYFYYYLILRNNLSKGFLDTLDTLHNINDTVFLDSSAVENTSYIYTIGVGDTDGHLSLGTELRFILPNHGPEPSEFYQVKGVDFIFLQLCWSKCADTDFKEFVIYRGHDPASLDSIHVMDAMGGSDTLFWTDRTLDSMAKTFYYSIKTVDMGALASWSDTVGGVNRRALDSDLVLIPRGWFTMGNNNSAFNQCPEHSVFLSPYLIDRYEVTIRRFVEFLKDGNDTYFFHNMQNIGVLKNNSNYSILPGREEHPITWVDYEGAKSYCEWAGGRLPTEAEWEKAARGPDKHIYAWGNDFYFNQYGPQYWLANYIVGYGGRTDSIFQSDGGVYSVPVGNYENGKSSMGVYDMCGNVQEWCSDWYSNQYSGDSLINPTGPQLGLSRVVRGGGFKSYPEEMQTTSRFRLDPPARQEDLGFRCVRELAKN
ncbi:MAG: formylglycine-generating enzyme family protein [bacterium]